MDRMLSTGETKEIKPKIWKNMQVKVFAECVDSETPYIHLVFFDYQGNEVFRRALEDVFALEIIDMMHKAIEILPSSK